MSHVRRSFLSVSDVIEANKISVGSEVPLGIISKIRSLVSDVTSYVKPTSNTDVWGNVNTLVNWNNRVSLFGQTAYAQVEFKHGYVYPTSYSLKGYNENICFAKEWYIYGFNEENGEKTLLSENKSEGSKFCGTAEGCNNANWSTFSINPVQKAFKYFRIVSKTPSCASWYIHLSGFEIFGVYSIDGRTPAKAKRETIFLLENLPFDSKFLLIIIICYPETTTCSYRF